MIALCGFDQVVADRLELFVDGGGGLAVVKPALRPRSADDFGGAEIGAGFGRYFGAHFEVSCVVEFP
ncbi:hypothetical protein SDC9_126650 [bioreactor metagenome]|uniref:Uncharacterized protein n=1 Tax=bioreactor metagenome TaxID=1076179 RepID=A0A645CRR4_9ZZZZ